jgi:hypothetical protein
MGRSGRYLVMARQWFVTNAVQKLRLQSSYGRHPLNAKSRRTPTIGPLILRDVETVVRLLIWLGNRPAPRRLIEREGDLYRTDLTANRRRHETEFKTR